MPKQVQYKKRIALLAVVMLLIPFCWFSNTFLVTTEYDFTHADIPKGFDGYRIVQLSDLHNAVFGKDDTALVERITALSPDLIVLTGDMIDASNHTNYDKALLLMKQLPGIAPTYYVYGNHELYLPDEQMEAFLSLIAICGVHYMDDEIVPLKAANGDVISMIGLNDHSLQGFVLENIMTAESNEQFHLLLAHEPQFIEDYAETGVDLVLSGHAHGGQFRLPFVGGLYAPDQGLLPQLTDGLHHKDETAIIISRGLGNSGFPLRLFNQPEIVCITLHSTE